MSPEITEETRQVLHQCRNLATFSLFKLERAKSIEIARKAFDELNWLNELMAFVTGTESANLSLLINNGYREFGQVKMVCQKFGLI